MLKTLAAYVHQIDPYMIKLWEGGPIRWYGMAYVVGFLLGYMVIMRVVSRGISPIRKDQVIDLIIALALGIVIGGRLGYVLFYKRELLGLIDGPPYWGVLAFHHGGMASHGAIIGGFVTCLWWSWRHKIPLGHVCDLLAFGFPPGVFIGRIANFINGELIGRPCSPDFPLAVKFPQEMFDWRPETVTPEQAQALHNAVAAIPGYNPKLGMLQQIYAEVLRHNQQVISAIEPVLTPRHPSQLYASLLEGLGMGLVLMIAWRRPRKPFFISGVCAITYSLARIVSEHFRMPDAHIASQEFEHFGITRGQILSLVLLAMGIWMIVYAIRSNAPALGGWAGPAQPHPTPEPNPPEKRA